MSKGEPKFDVINLDSWKRKPYFEHYYKTVKCTYSITLEIDITPLLKTIEQLNVKFYPTFIYIISMAVNSDVQKYGAVVTFVTPITPCYMRWLSCRKIN